MERKPAETYQPPRRLASLGRQLVAWSLPLMASGALILPGHASAQEQPSSPDQTSQPGEVQPHADIGFQDDDAITSGDPRRAAKVLSLAKQADATSWRLIIDPVKMLHGDTIGYDFAIPRIKQAGLELNLALSCKGVDWTDQRLRRLVGSVMHRYGSAVDEISPCNEPNYPGWLRPRPGQTKPQTYRYIYDKVYPLIKQSAPGVKVFYGELSSEHQPLKFLRQSLDCPDAKSSCEPVQTDGLAYHPYPYKMDTPPTGSSPAGQPGMGDLEELKNTLEVAHQADEIATPDQANPQRPDIYLTEYAYMTPTRGENKNRRLPMATRKKYISEGQRQRYYRQSLAIVCRDRGIARLSFYGVQPPSPDWPGTFNTSLVTARNMPTRSYNSIKSYVQSHPNCIKS